MEFTRDITEDSVLVTRSSEILTRLPSKIAAPRSVDVVIDAMPDCVVRPADRSERSAVLMRELSRLNAVVMIDSLATMRCCSVARASLSVCTSSASDVRRSRVS